MGDFVATSQGRLGYGIVQGFSPKAVYQKRDVVHFRGSAFAVLRDGVTGIEPVSDGVNYQLFVSGGEPGSSNAVWHSGTAVTGTGTGIVAGVPGSKAGDMYLSSDNANVYIATAPDTWDFVRNIEGPEGADGVDGQGVPTGGLAGQVLKKAGAGNFDTKWETLLAAGIGTTTSGTSVQAALDSISTAIGGRTLKPTLLWNGSWSTGSITVGNTNLYNIFLVEFEGWAPGLGFKNPHYNNIDMLSTNITDAQDSNIFFGSCTTSGNAWIDFKGRLIVIYSGGQLQSHPVVPVTNIWGLI